MSDPAEMPPAIADVARLWLARLESPHSRRAYVADLHSFIAFAGRGDLRDVTLADLVDWRDDLQARGDAPRTIRRRLSVVGSLLSFATAYGAVDRNFATLARKPRIVASFQERILTVDYVAMLLHAAESERDRLLIRLMYYSLARNAEVCALRWRSVRVDDSGHGVITIRGKGSRVRAVLVPSWLYAQMIRFRGAAGDEAPVFPGRAGRPIATRSVHDLIARTAQRARIPGDVSPHWLRHSAITHARNGGAPIELVQRDAGHSSIVTTAGYFHHTPRDGAALHLPII